MPLFNLTPPPIPDNTAPFVFSSFDDTFTHAAGGRVLQGSFFQTRGGQWWWSGQVLADGEVVGVDGGPVGTMADARAAVVAWGRAHLG